MCVYVKTVQIAPVVLDIMKLIVWMQPLAWHAGQVTCIQPTLYTETQYMADLYTCTYMGRSGFKLFIQYMHMAAGSQLLATQCAV